jgi:hypothetical protein
MFKKFFYIFRIALFVAHNFKKSTLTDYIELYGGATSVRRLKDEDYDFGSLFVNSRVDPKYRQIGGRVLRQLGYKQLFSLHFSSMTSLVIFCIHKSTTDYPL